MFAKWAAKHEDVRWHVDANQYNFSGSDERKMYYNNFEVVDVQQFIRPRMLEFVEHVDETMEIYKHRWGDAPLRFMQLHAYFNNRRIHHFCLPSYFHGGQEVTC